MLKSKTMIKITRVGVAHGFDGNGITKTGIVCYVLDISSIITTRRGSQFFIIGIGIAVVVIIGPF